MVYLRLGFRQLKEKDLSIWDLSYKYLMSLKEIGHEEADYRMTTNW